MFGRIITVVTLAAMIALLLTIQSTNPSSIGPVGILVVFFLLYIIFVGIFTWLVHGGSLLFSLAAEFLNLKKPKDSISIGVSYYYGSVLALGPIMLLAMRSVASIGVYEVALVSFFIVISIFYVKKRFR